MSGNNSDEVTPVPIPNTAVKLISADGSWGFAPARVGRRQANKKLERFICSGFFVFKIEMLGYKKSGLKCYKIMCHTLI